MNYYDGYDWDADGFPGEYVYGDSIYVSDYYSDERWKRDTDIPEYLVSSFGRVWSSISNTFIYGSPTGRNGHLDISLRRNGIRIHKYIHRMVAEAFIPNPHNYPVVRHLDDNPSNNHVDNLAWGTQYDNVQDCIKNGRFKYFTDQSREKAMCIRKMPIIAVNIDTGKQFDFGSQCEASRALQINQRDISCVLNNKHTNAAGYIFYRQSENPPVDIRNHKYIRHYAPIKAINIFTGESFIFRGQTEAAHELGMSVSSVSMCLSGKMHSAKGYRFEYLKGGR